MYAIDNKKAIKTVGNYDARKHFRKLSLAPRRISCNVDCCLLRIDQDRGKPKSEKIFSEIIPLGIGGNVVYTFKGNDLQSKQWGDLKLEIDDSMTNVIKIVFYG